MPSPWVSVVLALAAYRLTRLAGWDDFPLAVKIRAWIIGQYWIPVGPIGTLTVTDDEQGLHGTVDLTDVGRKVIAGEDLTPNLPGKQPPSEVDGVRPAYRRPTLAHLVHCPFCVGFWISLVTWLSWLAWHPVLYGLMPLAISGVVGLISKNLDP